MNNVRGGGRWAELWADHYCVNKEFHERKAVKDSARAISGKLIRVYGESNKKLRKGNVDTFANI